MTQGRPFLDYVNGLPVEVSPDSEDHIYIGGATSRKATGDSLGGAGPGGDGVTLEEVRDDLANVLTEGDNIEIAVNDGANTITISSPTWLPEGGAIGQALVKASSTDFDVEWDAVVIDPGFSSGFEFVEPESGEPPEATDFNQTWHADDTGRSYYWADSGDAIVANGVWVQFADAVGVAGADGADGEGVPAGGTAGQALVKVDGTDYNTEWADVSGSGAVDVSGTPVALDFARFTDANTIEGRSYAETISDLGALTTVAVPDDITATGTPSSSTYLRGDGAWATPSGTATKQPFYVIAANNAPTWAKDRADVVCDGTADQVEIQAALDLGYPVLLTQGLFNVSAQINITSLGVLRGSGWKTVIRPSSSYTTGDSCVIGSKNNSAVLWTIEDLAIDGAYRPVHGIRIYNTSQDSVDPPAPGADNYGTIRNVFIEGCSSDSTRGIWLDDNPDGLRSCNVLDVFARGCDIGIEINTSDNILSNIHVGAAMDIGFEITGTNNRFTNCKAFFTTEFGFNVTGPRNSFSVVEAQDAIGVAFRFHGHETTVAGAFANVISANRATTTAFDIWCEGSTFTGMLAQFSTGSSRTMDEAFDFNTSNNISVVGTIGNPESDFDNTDIIGSEGTGSYIRIARVGAPPYEGVTAATVTGTTDTLALADHGKQLSYTNSSLVTVTLANIYTGFECVLKSLGAGGLTIATGGMSYANGFTPLKTIAQGESLYVRQTAASTFEITGGSSA